jgi:hypothetical protein
VIEVEFKDGKIIFQWLCQGCDEPVEENVYDNNEAIRRYGELQRLEGNRKLVCGCGKEAPKCEMCGACCSYFRFIQATKNALVKSAHLAEWDGIEGYLIMKKKPWSKGHKVCIFLKKGCGCLLHTKVEQPCVCSSFNCKDKSTREMCDWDEFREFRRKWHEDGMPEIIRGEREKEKKSTYPDVIDISDFLASKVRQEG